MADQIQEAIKLIETGRSEQAHALLLEKLKTEPKNDVAWYWMSKVVATADLREECLQEALKYNPKNMLAQADLAEMQDQPAVAPSKWSMAENAAPKTRTRSAHPGSRHRANTVPAAIATFVLALILIAVTYFYTRQDLAYRFDGNIVSATVTKLDKQRGSAGVPDQCQAEYQFMAYGALRKGTVPIACADWNRLDDSRQMQIQYLVSQPDRSRVYPPAETTDRYAVMGFGLAALLIIVSIVLIVWRFWPVKSPQ